MEEVEARSQQVINPSTCSLLSSFCFGRALHSWELLCTGIGVLSGCRGLPLLTHGCFPGPAGAQRRYSPFLPRAPSVYAPLAGHKKPPGSGLLLCCAFPNRTNVLPESTAIPLGLRGTVDF